MRPTLGRTLGTTLGRAAGVGVLALVTLAGTPSSAQAAEWGEEEDEVVSTAPPSSDSSTVGQVSNCSVVSSPEFLGLSCGTSSEETVIVVKKILGDDPVPDCWHETLTATELQAMGLENRGGSTWFWEWCVSGISKEPNRYDPEFRVKLVSLDGGDDHKTLTERQRRLVDLVSTNDFIPPPIAAISPMAHPRVGAWVSFFDGSPRHQVTVQAGAVILRATQTRTYVNPYGEGTSPTLSCDGIGYRAERGDTPQNAPDACWFSYDRSSAAEADDAFPVFVTAHWDVDVSANGGASWSSFNSFDKSQVTLVPVTEIQTYVVQ